MAGTLSVLPATGEVIKSPEADCELEWRISDFDSLVKTDKMYFSPTFSFNGAIWRMYIDVELSHLNAGIIRESTSPSMRVEVALGFKTLTGKKDKNRYAEDGVKDGYETYVFFNCLQKMELLKRMLDLLPSNVLTVMCTLKIQKATEDPVRKYNNATICGLVWTANYVCYVCRTCAMQPTMALCSDCFQRGNHEGHDFYMFRSRGGFCDCGIVSAMNESGFCPKHGPQNQINQSETPPDLLFVTEVLMPHLFSRLNKHLQNASESDEPFASESSNIFEENKVFNDFKDLFLKKEDCDVLIKVQGREFEAHKAILKARSPVFASTFRNDMLEKSTGVLDIEDCDPSSFSDFLCFIYCGDREIISQANVFSLFTTADKYNVQDLTAQCTKFMKENLCVGTFCDTISLAVRHSEKELIKLTTDFFSRNAPKIILTEKWQSFLAENPKKGNELFIKLLARNTTN